MGGFRFLFSHRSTGLILLVLSGWFLAIGALDVLFVAVAISLLDKAEAWAGFLGSAFGLGGLAGSALAVGLVGRRRLTPALAVGVLADAFIVRLTLVPAVMALLGRHAWRMPRRLGRLLPDLDIEGAKLATER